MKKLLLLAFLLAARAYAQTPGEWYDIQDYWTDVSGGDALPPGTVSSVGIDASGVPSMNVGNSPITTAGNITLSWASLTANTLLLAPDNAAGTPTWRAMKPRDLAGSPSAGNCLTASSATVLAWSSCTGTTIANDTIWAAKGDIVAATANDAAAVTSVGVNNTYLMADSTASNGVSWNTPFLNLQLLHWEEEFCGPFRGAEQKNGSGATGSTTAGTVAHPCVRTISVGTATGVDAYQAVGAGVATPAVLFPTGGVLIGDFIYNISSIGDGTDVVKYVVGFCDKTATGTECSNGFYLYYDRAVSTTDWEFTFAHGGARTRVSCGAVGVGAYHHAQFVTNSAGTTATVTIDGVACSGGSPASNFPVSTDGFTAMFKADKTAGATTTFTLDMDYMGFVYNLTTTR